MSWGGRGPAAGSMEGNMPRKNVDSFAGNAQYGDRNKGLVDWKMVFASERERFAVQTALRGNATPRKRLRPEEIDVEAFVRPAGRAGRLSWGGEQAKLAKTWAAGAEDRKKEKKRKREEEAKAAEEAAAAAEAPPPGPPPAPEAPPAPDAPMLS